jgi:serine/threonine-protein phosphatase PGAM5
LSARAVHAAALALGAVLGLAGPARAADAPATGTGVHYVWLIRHGHYDRDSTVDDDVSGNGLDALGREQAKLVGARLARLPVKPASLVASTYRRARETAEIAGRAMGRAPVLDSLIRECTPHTPRADILRRLAPGEAAACDSTLALAWAKYLAPTPDADRHDVLVCHGNVIRWMTSRAVADEARHWLGMDVANASITVLAVRPDGTVRLVCFSDVGHLPVAKQSWAGAGWGAPRAR